MEIQELIIKSYGKFSNHRMTFKSGMNIIYGGNESGKTTIHSFIRAMLFGLSRGRGRAAGRDEYTLRQPWNAPGAFLGSMRIREAGEVYRIDRCFDRSAQPLSMVCETSGRESPDPQQDLDVLLGGISEAAFVNTVFIPQAHCETDEALAQELQRYMINCDSTMDGGLDVTQALQTLRRKKKRFEQQKKKEEGELEAQISQRQADADALRRELDLLLRQAEQYTRGSGQPYEAGAGFAENWPRQWENGPDAPGLSENISAAASVEMHRNGGESDWHLSLVARRILTVLFFAAGLLAALGAWYLQGQAIRIFLGIFCAVFWGMIFVVNLLFQSGSRSEKPTFRDMESSANCPPELLEEISERRTRYARLKDELEELYQRHVRPDGVDTEIAALTMAIDRICELSDGIYRANGGRLNEIASGILSEITEGRYNRIVMDDMAEVRIHTPSRVLGLHQVSGGTMQQIYFALRMAAGELFSDGKKLPVILDETFAMYDDKRLEAVMRWLKQSGRQVILFTCQTREREIMKRI